MLHSISTVFMLDWIPPLSPCLYRYLDTDSRTAQLEFKTILNFSESWIWIVMKFSTGYTAKKSVFAFRHFISSGWLSNTWSILIIFVTVSREFGIVFNHLNGIVFPKDLVATWSILVSIRPRQGRRSAHFALIIVDVEIEAKTQHPFPSFLYVLVQKYHREKRNQATLWTPSLPWQPVDSIAALADFIIDFLWPTSGMPLPLSFGEIESVRFLLRIL